MFTSQNYNLGVFGKIGKGPSFFIGHFSKDHFLTNARVVEIVGQPKSSRNLSPTLLQLILLILLLFDLVSNSRHGISRLIGSIDHLIIGIADCSRAPRSGLLCENIFNPFLSLLLIQVDVIKVCLLLLLCNILVAHISGVHNFG
ncbi:MAG: hypothetical protein EBZ48_13290 [Proteobacteria bacterium]|nr:hypothetical protein [Pseudomonadota bacterium]